MRRTRIQDEIDNFGLRSDFCNNLFTLLKEACQSKGTLDLSALFPNRKLTAKNVRNASDHFIRTLSSENLFAIMDLIPGRCNHLIGPAQYRALENNPNFQKLLEALMSPSETLSSHRIAHNRDNWLALHNAMMAEGLPDKITPEFLIGLNSALRKASSSATTAAEKEYEQEGPLGLRAPFHEIIVVEAAVLYLPQRAVAKEVQDFCEWANAAIAACDRREKNPIIFAGEAYQRLVSIHPFSNANGRTSRFLADLILRRYRLPPLL